MIDRTNGHGIHMPPWVMQGVMALIVSLVVGGAAFYVTTQTAQTSATQTIKTLTESVDRLTSKVETLSRQQASSDATLGVLNNTLEKSVREAMVSLDRRVTAADERNTLLAEQLGRTREKIVALEVELALIRRASETAPRTGGRGNP